MDHTVIEDLKIIEFILPMGILLGSIIIGFIVRSVIFSRLDRWAARTKTDLDNIIIDGTRSPFMIWCVMIGLYFSLDATKLPEGVVDDIGKGLLVLGILSVTIVLANVLSSMVRVYSKAVESKLPVTSLTQNITRIIIYDVGILVILNYLGISITPILATLGVGGLAVALALQDTLANLFSGFYISVARQLKVGDYVKLDSGEEGYIMDITLRTTKIRMLPNNVVLIPNVKLTQAIITNFYMPERELAVLVNLGVHYDSDLEHVEKVTCEVGKEVMKTVPGGVPEFDPFIRYNTFGDFSIGFTVILRGKEFVDQYLIKHEFVKRLHARYKKEGINIPYPIRAINYKQEGAQ